MDTELRKPGGLSKFLVTDREECGLIIQRDEPGMPRLRYVVRIPNHAENDEDYLILLSDMQNVEAALAEFESIVGFMHTHLPEHDCEPTDTDFAGAAMFPGMEYLIYQPSTERFCWYGPEVTET
jgi:proteasome lid subunit RPN8/RPN11